MISLYQWALNAGMASLTVTALLVVTILVLITLSAFFSSSESAIFSLSEDSLSESGDTESRSMTTLAELRADPHRLLVTILVGNNVVNVAIASLTTVLVLEYLPTGSGVTLATVLASFVVLVFGEIVPKSYGLGHANQWALRVARPISIVERILYPLVVVFDFVTRSLNRRLDGDTNIEKSYLDE